jgi:hypothetical protein
MPDVIQVHAFLPRQLKRRAFSALAQQERRFSHWLRDALEKWLQEVEQPRETSAFGTEDRQGVCRCRLMEAEE